MRRFYLAPLCLFALLVMNGCSDSSNHHAPTSSSTSTSTSTSTTSLVVTTTSTTMGDRCVCEVTFSVTNTETLGALQYDTSYAGLSGRFDGTAGAVDCTRLAGEFAAFNDIEAEARLSSAFISTTGFTGPIDVARCRYTPYTLLPPVSGDFPITITDQSRPDFSPANATVAVTDVFCPLCVQTTTTSTTIGGVGP